jgi:hypothetical protein
MEHPEGDVVFRHACKMGGDRLEAARFALSVRQVAGLTQVQEPRGAGGETIGGGGVGQGTTMTKQTHFAFRIDH